MYYQPLIVQTQSKLTIEELKEVLGIDNFELSLQIEKEEDKQSIGIKEVKKLIEWSYYKSNNLRLARILEADLLTTEAQNSLLKVLEDLSKESLIILETKNPSKLIQTVKSRCRIVIGKHKQKIDAGIDITSFLSLNYFERKQILQGLENKAELQAFLESLLAYFVTIEPSQNASDMIELLKLSIKSANITVSKTLILDTVNIFLETQ